MTAWEILGVSEDRYRELPESVRGMLEDYAKDETSRHEYHMAFARKCRELEKWLGVFSVGAAEYNFYFHPRKRRAVKLLKDGWHKDVRAVVEHMHAIMVGAA